MRGLFAKLFSSNSPRRKTFQSPPAGYLNPHTTLGELDLHLISEGRHENLWRVLGAHVKRTPDGELIGTAFSVWAPNARNLSLICDNNFWDKKTNPMIPLGPSGVWEVFIPDLAPGVKYKFAVQGRDGRWVDHADPFARQTELPPHTASIVNESKFIWSDENWMNSRALYQPWRAPVSVYEVHLGSWKSGLSYRELAQELGAYLKKHGFTHVEFLPVTEHPYSPSWGYQVSSYFAPTARFGSPDEF